MKKYLIIILVSLLIFSGCSKKEENNDKSVSELPVEKQTEIKNDQENEKDNIKEEEIKNEEQVSKIEDFPEAFEGRFTDLPIKFNDSKDKVIKELGEPNETTSWQGADLYIYDNLGIYIDPMEEKVTGLTAGIGYMTYGIQIGNTVDEVKEVLGKPDFEGINLESGASVLEYEAGDFVVEITIQPESKQSIGITLYSYGY